MSGPWEKFQEAAPEGPWSKFQEAPADEWKPTQYGFKVKDAVTPDTGKPTVQREDGAVYYGPEQGNRGKAGWFNDKGQRMPDDLQAKASWLEHPLTRVKQDLAQANNAAINDMAEKNREIQSKPFLGKALPPQLAGATQGLIDTGTAPIQLASHALGSNAMDPVVNALEQNYQQNYMPSQGGRMLGQAMPFIATMGASAPQAAPQALTAAQRVRQVLATIGKPAAIGAAAAPALTPEVGVQNEDDFWKRKAGEAKAGAALGAAAGTLPVLVSGAGAVKNAVKTAGEAPSPGAFLEELGNRFSGKTPGEAIKDAAWEKYNTAWDHFKDAIAPVDAQAGGIAVDYTPAIQKIESILGVGQKRPPSPLNGETQATLERFLTNLKEAQTGGAVDNSFAGAIDTIKWLGNEQRRLARVHGDTEARNMLNGVRDAVLESMNLSDPKLAQAAKDARRVFAEEVVPLFDKSKGGDFLTKIRDSARPEDLLVQGNQGSLARMLPGKAKIIAQGSSADPMLYSYLETALTQANKSNNPRIFADSLKKAMPAIEAIADPDTLKAIQGMVKVADFSNKAGHVANLATAAAAEKMGFHGAAGAGAAWGIFKPGMSGPGFLWKALTYPGTRKLLVAASKIPAGSAELGLMSNDIAKAAAPLTRTAPNVAPLRPMPVAASTGTPDQIAEK